MLRDTLTDVLRAALEAEGVAPPAEIRLERPAQREHGDWSSPVALAVAKQAGRNPRDLANALAARLSSQPPWSKSSRSCPGVSTFAPSPSDIPCGSGSR